VHDERFGPIRGKSMRKMIKIATLAGALLAAGCATLGRTPPLVGDSAEAVQARMGRPTAVYAAPDGQVLEYASGPMGQFTWMARIGPDGRMRSFEQVLTGEKFATIKPGATTKEQVLRTIGRPAEVSRVAMRDFEVWSYRYKESGVWNSMMHVHFDRAGVVQLMQNGPDPMYEEKRFFRD
jgi:outer membrane protein assembly factor BamE (lipoprotein component of BamABCDE complex)